jgi:hypothetical protein
VTKPKSSLENTDSSIQKEIIEYYDAIIIVKGENFVKGKPILKQNLSEHGSI